MGNRGYIMGQGSDHAIYVHWNGGLDSVEAFLRYAKLKGLPPLSSASGVGGLLTIITNFFGNHGLSVYLASASEALEPSGCDNGTYVVQEWEIIERLFMSRPEQVHYRLVDMLLGIDQAQPVADQLGEDFLRADAVPTGLLEVGDEVFFKGPGSQSKPSVFRVAGKGAEGKIINGHRVEGVPYVQAVGEQMGWENNINNYLTKPVVRVPEAKAEPEGD